MNVSLRRNRNPNNYACLCATVNIVQRLVYRKTYLSVHIIVDVFLMRISITINFCKKCASKAKGSTFTVVDRETTYSWNCYINLK